MRYGVLIATIGPTHEIRSTPTKEGSVVAAAGARSRAAGPSSPAPPSRRRSLFLPIAALLGFNPSRGQYSSTALIFVYIALPVAIKIAAALLIWFIRIAAERGTVRDELMGRA